MAVSLAFGVMFATFITLVMVPTTYLIIEVVRHATQKIISRLSAPSDSARAG